MKTIDYWRKIVADGRMAGGVLVPKKPKGDHSAKTAAALLEMERAGELVRRSETRGYIHLWPVTK